MHRTMAPSEFNIWPAERQRKAPEPAPVLASSMLPRGPNVVDMPTPADAELHRVRSALAAPANDTPHLVTIYPRDGLPRDQAIPVPLYSYAQLERMSVKGLKLVAGKLRDSLEQVGAEAPEVMISSQADGVIRWVLGVQIALANSVGLDVTWANFGTPDEMTGRGQLNRSERPAV